MQSGRTHRVSGDLSVRVLEQLPKLRFETRRQVADQSSGFQTCALPLWSPFANHPVQNNSRGFEILISSEPRKIRDDSRADRIIREISYMLKVLERVPADMSGLNAEKEKLTREVLSQKQNRAWESWLAEARGKMKIDIPTGMLPQPPPRG